MKEGSANDFTATAELEEDEHGGRSSRDSFYLLVIGKGTGSMHPLPVAGALTIGRKTTNEVVIDDASISREHAVLRIADEITIEDLDSVNGTRVGGILIEAHVPVQIRPGEAFELGSVVLVIQHRAPAGTTVVPRRIWAHGFFEGHLEEECARAKRSNSSFALLRVQCDPEAPASDIELILAEALRAYDVVGRYGPAEYEALLIDTDPRQSLQVAGRLAALLAARGIGVRTGLACFPRDGRDFATLVEHAAAAIRGDRPQPQSQAFIEVGGAMQTLHRLIERVADSHISVLILGETGVGKEVLAENVHRLSPRASKPFLRLNCAALTESLLESELFGHEKGSFTGAHQSKPGLFETAEGGTVFIDEVGELPLSTQVKMLRVIEERQVLRVGGLTPRAINVRFVSATNRDLEGEAERGTFRRDLFYRLNGITVVVPPLRERVSEIDGLARHFVTQACKQNARDREPVLARDALELLNSYSWPGNIRELRNMIERAVILCQDPEITAEHLPTEKMKAILGGRGPSAGAQTNIPALGSQKIIRGDFAPDPDADPLASTIPGMSVEELLNGGLGGHGASNRPRATLTREEIEMALAQCGGNQKLAAGKLGVSRRTLINRLDELGIARPRKRGPLD